MKTMNTKFSTIEALPSFRSTFYKPNHPPHTTLNFTNRTGTMTANSNAKDIGKPEQNVILNTQEKERILYLDSLLQKLEFVENYIVQKYQMQNHALCNKILNNNNILSHFSEVFGGNFQLKTWNKQQKYEFIKTQRQVPKQQAPPQLTPDLFSLSPLPDRKMTNENILRNITISPAKTKSFLKQKTVIQMMPSNKNNQSIKETIKKNIEIKGYDASILINKIVASNNAQAQNSSRVYASKRSTFIEGPKGNLELKNIDVFNILFNYTEPVENEILTDLKDFDNILNKKTENEDNIVQSILAYIRYHKRKIVLEDTNAIIDKRISRPNSKPKQVKPFKLTLPRLTKKPSAKPIKFIASNPIQKGRNKPQLKAYSNSSSLIDSENEDDTLANASPIKRATDTRFNTISASNVKDQYVARGKSSISFPKKQTMSKLTKIKVKDYCKNCFPFSVQNNPKSKKFYFSGFIKPEFIRPIMYSNTNQGFHFNDSIDKKVKVIISNIK